MNEREREKKDAEMKLIGYKISGTVDDLLQFLIKKYLSADVLMMLHFSNEYFCAPFFLSIRSKWEEKKWIKTEKMV